VVHRIAVLAGGEICRNDLAKFHVSKETARKPIDQRGETTDRGGEKDTLWFEHAAGFTKRLLTRYITMPNRNDWNRESFADVLNIESAVSTNSRTNSFGPLAARATAL
jgi:hypothetical protein